MSVLDGGAAVVTGGASGIGLALVGRLASAGVEVTVVDVAGGAAETSAARTIVADVADPAAWEAVVRTVGRLDAAFLNAGVLTSGSFLDAPWDDVDRVLRTNVDGVLLGVRALAPLLEASGGVVVVTASIYGLEPLPLDPVYTLTKHALVGFVRAAANWLRDRGVRLVAVCPPVVDTDLMGERVELLRAARVQLLSPEAAAGALVAAAVAGESGAVYGVDEAGELFEVPAPPITRRA